MPHTRSRATYKHHTTSRSQSLVDLGREAGPCLYAIRMPDGLVKVGYSQNVIARIRWLGGLDSIIALRSGTYEEEQEIHRRLKPYRALRREYYHPVPTVFQVVEDMLSMGRTV